MRKIVVLWYVCASASVAAQEIKEKDSLQADSVKTFHFKKLVIPAALIGYGILGIESDQLKLFNTQIRDEVTEDIDEKITIDDFSQYAPAASVFALDAFGVKAKHSLRDRTVILATSYLICRLRY